MENEETMTGMPKKNTAGSDVEQPSPLMDGIHRLRSTSLELRSKLRAVLERETPDLTEAAKALEDRALDVIADTQDILGDILSRLIV